MGGEGACPSACLLLRVFGHRCAFPRVPERPGPWAKPSLALLSMRFPSPAGGGTEILSLTCPWERGAGAGLAGSQSPPLRILGVGVRKACGTLWLWRVAGISLGAPCA